MTESILDTEKGRCFICGRYGTTQRHHIFGGSNRKWSEEDGLVVYLCLYHHTGSNEAVHNNRALDLELKRDGQRAWEACHGDRDEFMKRYGKNFLMEE